jgi:two-component system response regulator
MEFEQIELLLIEDNLEEASLVIRNLEKHQMAHQMVHIADGAEALDYIFAKGKYAHYRHSIFRPRLILLDLSLPNVCGKEILRKIRKDERTKLIPVVILSASDKSPDISDCYDLGANSYIVKPVDHANFSDAVSKLGCYWVVENTVPENYNPGGNDQQSEA